MKLEAKHIIGYLPYELKCNYKAGMHTGTNCLISGVDLDGVKLNMPLEWLIFDYVKPILKPISDLRKDDHFDLYMELLEEMESVNLEYFIEALENNTYYTTSIDKLRTMEQFMLKHHFDLYGLIPAGLADIA